MPEWLAFLIHISVVFILYFPLQNLDIQINLIGHQNEKIKRSIIHFVSFGLSGIVRFSVSAFVVFLGLSFISELTSDKPVYLFSVLFFLVFLIFFSESQPNFFTGKSMRIILHIRK